MIFFRANVCLWAMVLLPWLWWPIMASADVTADEAESIVTSRVPNHAEIRSLLKTLKADLAMAKSGEVEKLRRLSQVRNRLLKLVALDAEELRAISVGSSAESREVLGEIVDWVGDYVWEQRAIRRPNRFTEVLTQMMKRDPEISVRRAAIRSLIRTEPSETLRNNILSSVSLSELLAAAKPFPRQKPSGEIPVFRFPTSQIPEMFRSSSGDPPFLPDLSPPSVNIQGRDELEFLARLARTIVAAIVRPREDPAARLQAFQYLISFDFQRGEVRQAVADILEALVKERVSDARLAAEISIFLEAEADGESSFWNDERVPGRSGVIYRIRRSLETLSRGRLAPAARGPASVALFVSGRYDQSTENNVVALLDAPYPHLQAPTRRRAIRAVGRARLQRASEPLYRLRNGKEFHDEAGAALFEMGISDPGLILQALNQIGGPAGGAPAWDEWATWSDHLTFEISKLPRVRLTSGHPALASLIAAMKNSRNTPAIRGAVMIYLCENVDNFQILVEPLESIAKNPQTAWIISALANANLILHCEYDAEIYERLAAHAYFENHFPADIMGWDTREANVSNMIEKLSVSLEKSNHAYAETLRAGYSANTVKARKLAESVLNDFGPKRRAGHANAPQLSPKQVHALIPFLVRDDESDYFMQIHALVAIGRSHVYDEAVFAAIRGIDDKYIPKVNANLTQVDSLGDRALVTLILLGDSNIDTITRYAAVAEWYRKNGLERVYLRRRAILVQSFRAHPKFRDQATALVPKACSSDACFLRDAIAEADRIPNCEELLRYADLELEPSHEI